MNNFDLINGLFTMGGAFFLSLPNVIQILKEKSSKGLNPYTIAFLISWKVWNLVYYPSLGQFTSAIFSLLEVIFSTIWLVLILKYREN